MGEQKTEQDTSVGEKHAVDTQASEPNKRQKVEKKQATLEETLATDDDQETKNEGDEPEANGDENSSSSKPEKTSKEESAVHPAEEPDVPASILEKGIIYFFLRGRVGIDEPSSVNDVARSYFIMRPIEKDAKLGEGPIGDAGNTRLFVLPKKVLPKSGKDRFMTFVEKADASFDSLREEFLSSSDYETKTAGTRHTPAPAPFGEGVYAITTTGRESHLAYIITLPEKLGDLQETMGLKQKGSFIISSKNPKYEGPSYARLPEGPKYPKEIIDEFRALRWLPTKPEHLNYANAQILLIGESQGLEKALEPQEEDQKEGKEEPEEALEHLEEEDLKRMRDLPGDQSASVFADLTIRASDYPKLQTTFK